MTMGMHLLGKAYLCKYFAAAWYFEQGCGVFLCLWCHSCIYGCYLLFLHYISMYCYLYVIIFVVCE